MVASLLGRRARWRRGSLASPLAAALCVYSLLLFFYFLPIPFGPLLRFSGPCVCRYTSCSLCAPEFVVCVFVVAVVCSRAACGSLLLVPCGCPSYHASFRAGGLE